MKKVLFVCVHNSCRSQIAEALGKHFLADHFEFYSCGSEVKQHMNQDAVRLMKSIYNIDMEKDQYSKLIKDVPQCDIVISMGCEVSCPYVGQAFDDNWQLTDPTGRSDEDFIKVIDTIKQKIESLYD